MASQKNDVYIIYTKNGISRELSQQYVIKTLVQLASKQPERAFREFYTLCLANPNAIELRWSYLSTLLELQFYELLIDVADDQLKRDDRCRSSYYWKSQALRHLNRETEAIQVLEHLTNLYPQDIASLNTLGLFYKDAGELTKAKHIFEQILAVQPTHASTYWYQSDIVSDHQQQLQRIVQLLDVNSVAANERYFLYFSAYRHAEKIKQTDQAFRYLEQANRLMCEAVDYDIGLDLRINNNVTDLFDKKFCSGLPATQQQNFKPIFIMGMPRSGTTLVEQIIASHSGIAGGDETTALSGAIDQVKRQSAFNGNFPQWIASRTEQEWQQIGDSYFQRTLALRGDKHIHTDKNQFNYRSIGIIKAALPDSKIIIVDRHPMDVCFGCYRQLFVGAKFSYDFNSLAKMYRSFQDVIEHWQSVMPEMILRVQYEDLVQRPNEMIEAMFNFIGLKAENACYEFYNSKRNVKTLSSIQVREPIFTSGIGRWKQYESQLLPLKAALLAEGVSL